MAKANDLAAQCDSMQQSVAAGGGKPPGGSGHGHGGGGTKPKPPGHLPTPKTGCSFSTECESSPLDLVPVTSDPPKSETVTTHSTWTDTITGEQTKVTSTASYDDQGNLVGRTESYQYADGTSAEWTSSSDGQGGSWESSVDTQGNIETRHFDKDGKLVDATRESTGQDGSQVIEKWDSKSKSWKRVASASGCGVDAECANTCNSAATYYGQSQLAMDCLAAGGATPLCSGIASSNSCCSNSSAFPVDPKVARPNELGDMSCGGVASVTVSREACSAACSVAATDANCVSNCSSNRFSVPEWSVLDDVCTSVLMEDACHSSHTIGVPAGGGAPGPSVPGGFSPPKGGLIFGSY